MQKSSCCSQLVLTCAPTVSLKRHLGPRGGLNRGKTGKGAVKEICYIFFSIFNRSVTINFDRTWHLPFIILNKCRQVREIFRKLVSSKLARGLEDFSAAEVVLFVYVIQFGHVLLKPR